MADQIDAEINGLLSKLTKIQSEVGGGKVKTQRVGEDGKVDAFLELRDTMIQRLENIKDLLEKAKGEDRFGPNAKTAIGTQSEIRKMIAALSEELTQLESMYQTEAKKRKSKWSSEELALRQNIVKQFHSEIQTIKDMQRAGYVPGLQANQLVRMEDSEMFSKTPTPSSSKAVFGSRNNDMTDGHRQQLQLVRERDQEIDQEIGVIGLGLDELKTLALAQNNEVKLQNNMLESLENKIDGVHDQVSNINKRLKTTLEEARSSDKICVDIICLLILIGLIIVIYKLTEDDTK